MLKGILIGVLLTLVLTIAVVWDYRRAQRKRSPPSWVYCPFCPPTDLFGDGKMYAEQVAIAGKSRDGRSYDWAWCGRCGALMLNGTWRAPKPGQRHPYRGAHPPNLSCSGVCVAPDPEIPH